MFWFPSLSASALSAPLQPSPSPPQPCGRGIHALVGVLSFNFHASFIACCGDFIKRMYVVNAGGRLGAYNAAVTEWLLPAFVIIFRTWSVSGRNHFWTKRSDLFYPVKLDCFPKEKKKNHQKTNRVTFPLLEIWKISHTRRLPFRRTLSQGESEQGDPEVTNLRGVQGSAPVKRWQLLKPS